MKIFKDCTEDQITQAAQALIDGHLVAFPTETVYGLGADASNASAVSRVYEVKGRPKDHPLIVHISSQNQMVHWTSQIPDYALKLARTFWPGPLTLILPRSDVAKDFITGGQQSVGLRVPDDPVALELINKFENFGGKGIAAPSANKFGAVSPTTAEAVKEELENDFDMNDIILDNGQCKIGIESTIIDCTKSIPRVVRSGTLTNEMIETIVLRKIEIIEANTSMKFPGSFKSHYAPKAKVKINSETFAGEGFIALSSIPTPSGAVRLISPLTMDDFAKDLYLAFRMADKLDIKVISVLIPNHGVMDAIKDRLQKASYGFK